MDHDEGLDVQKLKNFERIQSVEVSGRVHEVELCCARYPAVEIPNLVIVSYLPNKQAAQILEICLDAIRKYTLIDHQVWVVDNNSPEEQVDRLVAQSECNLILNRTEPIGSASSSSATQTSNGSYANGIALELACWFIPEDSKFVMPLHMDTMPCSKGWLSFLMSRIEGNVRAAGVRMDKRRESAGVLHVLGYLLDYQLYKRLGLSFMPNLPRYDVGDLVTLGLRSAGYDVFACRNTLWVPELVELLPDDSPFKLFSVDRSFDDDGNVIFLHLGRGVRKTFGTETRGVTPLQWIDFAKQFVL